MSVLSNVIDDHHMEIIKNEFVRLEGKCYLENAGTALYPQKLLNKINDDLLKNVYMNPHSDKYTRDCIEQIRCMVLNHFNTDNLTYTVIFTSGTTQSLKLVLETFQFHNNNDDALKGSFIYLRDNHTSVIGLRELAENKNVDVVHISHNEFLSSLKILQTSNNLQERNKNKSNTLLVYPAQSNFNGFKYPLNHLDNIKNGCLQGYLKKQLCDVNCNWYILLDAASLIATNKLDLSVTQPDFVCLSFYKIFGFPTGLGALLVKNNSADVLSQKKYFGGGTVDIVLSSEDYHVKRNILYERLEDGTQPFLSIIALKHCFEIISLLIPKVVNNNVMDTISYHTYYLAKDLYEQLKNLKHENGNKAAILYMDSDFMDIKTQGGIVTFNLLRKNGSYIGYVEFQHMADLFNISVRTGCFCNSGSCQRHLKISNKEMKAMHNAGHKCGDEIDLIDGKPTGAIRVSFGYYNTFDDVDKLILMISKCFLRKQIQKPYRKMINFNKNITQRTNGVLPNEQLSLVLNNINFCNGNDVPDLPEYYNNKYKMTLTEIAIFPIKSCGAFKIKSGWKIGIKGLEFDREWMIVKENGICLTQKQCPLMCKIQPFIDLGKRCLTLYFDGQQPISIPLDPSIANKYRETQVCQSKVCTDLIKGYDCGDEVADWISNALGISFLRLIRQSCVRFLKKKASEEQTLLSLSNQAQYLLINTATVRWLKDKITDDSFSDDINSLVDRFRGNLIIDSKKELIERDWQKVIIGKHEFKVEGQCSRCQMVCIDQRTGEKTVEPLRTISQEFGGKLRFGIYLSYIGPIYKCNDRMLKTYSEVIP
ncbi:molybdenum cofactor sulfurase [Nymphalis io]|uniref:molybdenum cofactor sulfurase n=1 Tax=Inachis io TaxID=171585 RepID=UPI0021696F38|nr:molybdenum cofactor sulfurase [Nymphalis io]XP_050343263.1 molybdenum cofactor sulfurase [Nymphalis io]XP_050343264.1 molybdenum cofactor sulfurase [Nymphalis io]